MAILRKWISPDRVIPVMTILGAAIAIALSTFQIITLSISENIIIALLGLIAIDGLTERLTLLERILEYLQSRNASSTLRTRWEILTPAEHAKNAKEINILAVHATSVILTNLGFYKQRLDGGSKMRIILMNHHDECVLDVWGRMVNSRSTRSHIQSSLNALNELKEYAPNNCTIKLLDVFLPFSMFGVDLSSNSGSMIVEYHNYKMSMDERLHIHLTASRDSHLFEHYIRQFKQAWEDAKEWVPSDIIAQ